MSIQTPIEVSGLGKTSYAEEVAFWAALAADSPRFSYEAIGKSQVRDRDLFLIRIGYPTAPAQIIQDNSLMICAGVHMSEPASREALIALVRDWCYTEDPTLTAYLASRPIYVIPTGNPDQVEIGARSNARGENINRDFLALRESETRVITSAVAAVQPDLWLDMHEYGGYNQDMMPLGSEHPQIHTAVRTVYGEVYAAVSVAAVGTGRTFGPYPYEKPASMSAESIPLAFGIPGITTETPIDSALTERMATHKVTTPAVIEYHRTHAAECLAAKRAARSRWRPGSVSLQEGPVVTPAPSAYRVTAEQHALLMTHRDLWSLATTPDGPEHFRVPLVQPAQAAISLILDPESPYKILDGERLREPLPPLKPVSWGPVRVGGASCPVESVHTYQNGALSQVWH